MEEEEEEMEEEVEEEEEDPDLFEEEEEETELSFESEEEEEEVEEPSFDIPTSRLLSEVERSSSKLDHDTVKSLSKKLLTKLSQFSIEGEITAIKTGPALVLFEYKPKSHIKVSRIKEMENDLSLALSSESVRIIAPIPGRDVVGIEASMPNRKTVPLKELLNEKEFFEAKLPLVLGRRADNLIGIKDLSRIPHLLVAGTTGSGKSMFIISFLTSLLLRHSPKTLRLLLIDPKQVDLSLFKEIPHLLNPIITSGVEASSALLWGVSEMEKRYRSLSMFKARDYASFNEAVKNLSKKEKKFHEEKQEELGIQGSYYFEPLPYQVIIVEEFGDLMADRNIRKSVENSVVRLAQKARASGIHLVLAMQSPRKDVLTGLIKTNIPGRISFKVTSGTDSRVILDENGAEKLLSHGDMLFLEPGSLKPSRYQSPLVKEKDVEEITSHWRKQSPPLYEKISHQQQSSSLGATSLVDSSSDPMFDEIVEYVKTCKVVSASFLQRRFRIGYPRAARIIEQLTEEGKIGPPQGSRPREVLIQK